MNTIVKTKNIWLAVILVAVYAATLSLAEDTDLSKTWKCLELLDEQTQKDLASCEDFFAGIYQKPQGYEDASEKAKADMVKQWLKKAQKSRQLQRIGVQSNEYDEAVEAVASLGIAKVRKSVGMLTKVASAPSKNYRLNWVATRSLGLIAERSSIPTLINLLDHINWNTRTYAKVGLAEITGVYFGDDKKKWKNWKGEKTHQLRTSQESKTTTDDQRGARRSYSSDKLGFSLPDTFGRKVDSQDYANTPVLIMSGACWCGGCQQDAEPLRKIAAEYAPRALQTIRTVAGDNELAALDFQRHYRLGFVQLLDTNRAFEKRYNRDGWTFLMLADQNGKIVYKVNGPREQDWRRLRNTLNDILPGLTANKTIVRDGTTYMPATLQRTGEIQKHHTRDRFASLACGSDGKVYVVFTTNRNGSDDIFIRVFDGDKWSQDMPIAATDADEYDGTVLIDKQGRIQICWTSNADGKNYNIFITSFTDPSQPGAGVQLTHHDDDAMHARMACDEKNRIWVTYYKWHKMGQRSRDKEVYVRVCENGKWSDEIQVSPTDVPRYEDHTEPAISAYGDGVVLAWSWDFHPPVKGYSDNAAAPSIFMRTVNSTMHLGKISSISEKSIDVTPAIAACRNRQIWCAWDSLARNRKKKLCISSPRPGRDNPVSNIKALNEPAANVCSPCFATGPAEHLTLLWSETSDGNRWVLKRADLDAGKNRWSAAETVASEGNPQYCSGGYDAEGQLWVSYSADTDHGREIVVKKLQKEKAERKASTGGF